MSEKVLVFPRSSLEELGVFQGFSKLAVHYIAGIFSRPTTFLDRDAAEEDFDYKQIIPYTILTKNGNVFSYVRGKSGGEARLKKKRSIGIGGHVNDGDGEKPDYGTVIKGQSRENLEEVSILGSYVTDHIGVINDDGNDVGKVHFGIVYRVELMSSSIKVVDTAIAEPGFVTIEEALEPTRFAEYEPWSRYVLEAIRDGEIRLDESD